MKIGHVDTDELFFILGPCVIETLDHALRCAEFIADVEHRTGAQVIYKSSFDKANRSSGKSYRGPGIDEGLRILEHVRKATGLPILTDVHEAGQAVAVAQVADVLQTPAFLARQTDFIQAVASAGKPMNIKKGQFMAPQDMANVVAKCAGNDKVMLCERGATFGYNNLVVDMRGLKIMRDATDCPIVFDASHSCQLPGANGTASGGDRKFVPLMAQAAVAAGVDGVFIECHNDPDNAPCDGPNMLMLDGLEELLARLLRINAALF